MGSLHGEWEWTGTATAASAADAAASAVLSSLANGPVAATAASMLTSNVGRYKRLAGLSEWAAFWNEHVDALEKTPLVNGRSAEMEICRRWRIRKQIGLLSARTSKRHLPAPHQKNHRWNDFGLRLVEDLSEIQDIAAALDETQWTDDAWEPFRCDAEAVLESIKSSVDVLFAGVRDHMFPNGIDVEQRRRGRRNTIDVRVYEYFLRLGEQPLSERDGEQTPTDAPQPSLHMGEIFEAEAEPGSGAPVGAVPPADDEALASEAPVFKRPRVADRVELAAADAVVVSAAAAALKIRSMILRET